MAGGGEIDGLRRAMARVGRLLYARQLIVAAEGNLSARLPRGLFLATPAGACKGLLTPGDLVVVDEQGRTADGSAARVSSEWPLHRQIYAARPDAGAVCHAHPPWATAFATAREPLEGCLLPEAVATLGGVPLAEYATPGTAEVPLSVRGLVRDHDAFLLANHGVVTVGETITAAYFKLETVERLAQVTLLARLLGGERRLSPGQVAALMSAAGAPSGSASCVPARDATGAPADGDRDLETLAARVARAIVAELGTSGGGTGPGA